MGVTVDTGSLGPITFASPTLKVEICFDTDPFPTYVDSIEGNATGYWRLGEASGNFADSSGNGYTATATGGGFSYGQPGALPADTNKSAAFGTASYATTAIAPTTAQLAFGFSCEAWIKRASAPSGNGVIAGINGSAQMYIDTSGKLNVAYYNGTSTVVCTSTSSVCTGSFHHVVGVWNTAELWVFVDGQIACTPIAAVTPAVGNANALGIGAFADGTAKLGAVTLDEVAFYEVALTPLQIQNHYISKDVGLTPTWTDVTNDVMNVTTSMGEQWERDTVEAGTANLTLDNTSRKYDPTNASSTYYPNVIPMRRLRISAVMGGTSYWLHHGYIERWPQTWENPDWAEVNITSVDGFEFLTQSYLDGYIAQSLSGTQVARALDIAGWSQTNRNLNAGAITISAQTFWPYNGSTDIDTAALNYIQGVAATESGIFFIHPGAAGSSNNNGTATFQDQNYRTTNSNSTTSQGTFGDADDESEFVYTQLTPSFDKDRIINDSRITLSDGVTIKTDTNNASIRQYFRRTYALDTSAGGGIVNGTDGQALANTLVSTYAQPAWRIDSITMKPLVNASLWAQALQRQISDRITVNRRPPGGGYKKSVLSVGPKLYWRLGDPLGSATATDISGYNNPGTYGSGVTLAEPGALANDDTATSALFNDGSTAYVSSTYNPFVSGSQRTFMGWANRSATTTFDFLFCGNGGSHEPFLGIPNASESTNFNPNSSGTNLTWTSSWPGLNQWVHWAVTYNDTTKVAELFINGVSQGQQTATVAYDTGSTYHFYASQQTGNPFNGYMQDMAVFESILSSAQIAALASADTTALISKDVYIEHISWNITNSGAPDWDVTWITSPAA